MVGFLLFLILVVYPIFLIVSAIIGGGGSSGPYFDSYHKNEGCSNNSRSDSSRDGYKYSNDDCCCECDDCFDNDDCDCW